MWLWIILAFVAGTFLGPTLLGMFRPKPAQ